MRENKNAREKEYEGKLEKWKSKKRGKVAVKKEANEKKKLNERMKTDVTKCMCIAYFFSLLSTFSGVCECSGITGRVRKRKCAHSMALWFERRADKAKTIDWNFEVRRFGNRRDQSVVCHVPPSTLFEKLQKHPHATKKG